MWSSFTVASPDPPEIVRGRLADALTDDSPGWFDGPTTFRGEVRPGGFRVRRNVAQFGRSVPLVATGRFVAKGGGTCVAVATRPRWGVFVVLGAANLAAAAAARDRLAHGGVVWPEVVFFAAVLAAPWLGLFVSCTVEERLYQKALARILLAPR